VAADHDETEPAEFVAVTFTVKNLDRSVAVGTKVLAVALVMAEHPLGVNVEAVWVAVQRDHW
jgi:hypothetical protein